MHKAQAVTGRYVRSRIRHLEATTLSNEAVRAQLGRIVASATFHGAQRAIRLLGYLVEQTLLGQAAALKEFTVGVDALGRGAAFDPRTDSIARVEASRLRNRLDLYYAKEGMSDPVRIWLPRGGYVPVFEPRAIDVAPRTASIRRWQLVIGIAALLAIIAGIGIYSALKPTPPPQSVVVIPFHTDPQTEYLADGLAENLINNLSRLPRLRVTARSIAFTFKDKTTDPMQIGRQLNVGAVVTGRVASHEGMLEVQVEMVDAATGRQIWGERYERQSSGILAVQEAIGVQIADNLIRNLSGDEQRQLTKRYTDNPEAYQLYLQGLFFSSKPTRKGIQSAIEYYTQAIAKDPQFARAYVNLATCYELRSAEEGPGTWLQEAKNAVTRAVRIDDSLAEAHAELGFLKWIHDLDATGAESELQHALELDPRSATAHFNYSRVLAETGRFEQALMEASRAIALDPLSIQIRKRLPYVLFLARRYDEAMVEYQKLIELAPDFVQSQRELGLVYEQKGMFDKALRQFQLTNAMPENYAGTMARADIGHLYAVSGQRENARSILAELVGKADHSYVSAYDIAVIHAGLNEPGPAFTWLARAIEQRPFFIGWLNVDPRLDGLRKDSRFGELLKSLKH
jgi:TolB-like protein/Flp pilus assembly protein TadD